MNEHRLGWQYLRSPSFFGYSKTANWLVAGGLGLGETQTPPMVLVGWMDGGGYGYGVFRPELEQSCTCTYVRTF